jgi:hypothetical protein
MDSKTHRECRSCQEVFALWTCFTCRWVRYSRYQQVARGLRIEDRCRECHDELEHKIIDCRHLIGRRRRR